MVVLCKSCRVGHQESKKIGFAFFLTFLRFFMDFTRFSKSHLLFEIRFSQKVMSASKAAFCMVSAKFNPCAFTSHSSQVGCVGHTGIFTLTSQRSSWPVLMSSRVEYSGYAVYPRSFRVSHKSAGKPPSSRQFKWVRTCASTVTDLEADIWNKWQLSEPDANTCTKLSSHGYKGMSHTQTTSKGFNLPQGFGERK
jgi:hypothetical protein